MKVKVIATDKTGTLTMNQMTVTALIWGKEEEYMVPIHSEISTNARGSKADERRRSSLNTANVSSTMKDLILGACLCNNAAKQSSVAQGVDNPALESVDDKTSVETTQIVGDAADVAMYHLCHDKCLVNIEQVKKVNPRINILPFNSKNKFMITANLLEQTSAENVDEPIVLVTLKGAPDFVLSRCSNYKDDTEEEIYPMTTEFRSTVQERQENLGKSGYRVIAMLQQRMKKSEYDARIEEYKESKNQRQQQACQPQVILDEPDLNGLPGNNYCFIGKDQTILR